MTQILFIDFLGVYHHHLALEMNQTHNNGWVQQKTASKVPHSLLHRSHLSLGTPIPNTARELDPFLFQ